MRKAHAMRQNMIKIRRVPEFSFRDREELEGEIITQTFDICEPSIVCTAGRVE